MKLTRSIFAVALLTLGPIVLWGCMKESATTAPQTTEVRGALFGTATTPRDSLPESARKELDERISKPISVPGGGTFTITLINNGRDYEFRRTYPTDSLTMELGGQPVELHSDGTFIARNVAVGQQQAVFKIREIPLRVETYDVRPNNTLPLTIDVQCVGGHCSMHDMHNHSTNGIMKTYPCLDNNGVGYMYFTYSDCWESLFMGPPWYNWMCWSEAMDKIHDHSGNIWCNGKQNCSLFVHGWDWNKQDWHVHYSFWWPKY